MAFGQNYALVLDGATAPKGIESGCIHDVPWLVTRLGTHLAAGLSGADAGLPDLLAAAIRQTCQDHADTCDLDNPASPSSTVACWRTTNGRLEYLSLADSSILIEVDRVVHRIVDDRTDHLLDYSPAAVRAVRNQVGTPDRPTFWVASTKPEAAHHAVHGSIPLANIDRIALLSDGASRYADRFSLGGSDDMMNMLALHGPLGLIRAVREAEAAETVSDRAGRRGKPQDDATVLLATFPSARLRGAGIHVLPNGKIKVAM
uniref:protein phosphatase 2C domain-containing protein n=1 Tax=Actinokineospora sp. CA-119265 TaxID=3239890 RepID=UPI003F492943